MVLNDFLADRQSDSGPGAIAAMQAFKQHEYVVEILRFDADAIILNADHVFRTFGNGGNVHDRRLFAPVLDRVPDQVLEHLR